MSTGILCLDYSSFFRFQTMCCHVFIEGGKNPNLESKASIKMKLYTRYTDEYSALYTGMYSTSLAHDQTDLILSPCQCSVWHLSVS